MIGLLLAATLAAAPNVKYVVKVEARTWQPLSPEDTERLIEQRALEPLTKQGLVRLEKSKFSELGDGDFSLLMEGRFIEDAGQFSVYLSFSPQQRTNAPSVYVLDTDEVEDKSPAEIQKRVAALVSRAASKLMATIAPHLRAGDALAPLEVDSLPLDWGQVDLPVLRNASGAVKALTDVRNPDHVRFKAQADLSGHALDQPSARMALELCAVSDPQPRLRAACIGSLAPVARTRVETQRLLLQAMRTDIDTQVLRAIAEVSKSFVGLSRKEALATWMQVVAEDRTPGEGANEVASLLAEENSVPNLELAVAKCLQGESLSWQKKDACMDKLLPKVPLARRPAAVWRFLETVQLYDNSATMLLDSALQHAFGRGSEKVDGAVVDMLLQRALTRPNQQGVHSIVYFAKRHASPTLATIDALLSIAKHRRHSFNVFNMLSDLVRSHPELKAPTLDKLKQFAAETTWMTSVSNGDPNRDLAQLIKRLSS